MEESPSCGGEDASSAVNSSAKSKRLLLSNRISKAFSWMIISWQSFYQGKRDGVKLSLKLLSLAFLFRVSAPPWLFMTAIGRRSCQPTFCKLKEISLGHT